MSETTTAETPNPRQHDDDPGLNELVWIRHPGLPHKPPQQVTRAKAALKEGSGYQIVDGPPTDGGAGAEDQDPAEDAPQQEPETPQATPPAAKTAATRRTATNTEEQS